MTAPDPLAVIEETLQYAKGTLDRLWRDGKTSSGITIDPALAALASLKQEREAHQELREALWRISAARSGHLSRDALREIARAALDGEQEENDG